MWRVPLGAGLLLLHSLCCNKECLFASDLHVQEGLDTCSRRCYCTRLTHRAEPCNNNCLAVPSGQVAARLQLEGGSCPSLEAATHPAMLRMAVAHVMRQRQQYLEQQQQQQQQQGLRSEGSGAFASGMFRRLAAGAAEMGVEAPPPEPMDAAGCPSQGSGLYGSLLGWLQRQHKQQQQQQQQQHPQPQRQGQEQRRVQGQGQAAGQSPLGADPARPARASPLQGAAAAPGGVSSAPEPRSVSPDPTAAASGAAHGLLVLRRLVAPHLAAAVAATGMAGAAAAARVAGLELEAATALGASMVEGPGVAADPQLSLVSCGLAHARLSLAKPATTHLLIRATLAMAHVHVCKV